MLLEARRSLLELLSTMTARANGDMNGELQHAAGGAHPLAGARQPWYALARAAATAAATTAATAAATAAAMAAASASALRRAAWAERAGAPPQTPGPTLVVFDSGALVRVAYTYVLNMELGTPR